MITYGLDEDAGEEGYRLFLCTATTTTRYRDSDRYLRSKESTETLSRETLESLYDMMARHKIHDQRPPDRDGERVDVDFGPIYEVKTEQPFELSVLESTEIWQQHARQIAEAQRQADAKHAELTAKQAATQEKAERDLLETLKAKYET